jgi:hypothetical protein
MIHHLWFTYFWPSLMGNGPEALAQTVLYGLIALIFIPPFRRWFARHIKSIHEKLDGHHEEMLRQAERHHVAQLKLARENHNAHMQALAKRTQPRKAPVKKTGLASPK